MKALILAEHDNVKLKTSTLSCLRAASKITNDITMLVVGFNCKQVAESACKCEFVSKVLFCDSEIYENFLAESLTDLVLKHAKNFTHILAPATTFGKNILPRVAALLDVAQISDVIEIQASDIFVRPIYAGNALETVQSLDPVKVITIRATNFEKVSVEGNHADLEEISPESQFLNTFFVNETLSKTERPELTSARVILSGGRGLQSAENFKLLENIADKIGAAIGASRAAVDAGFAPNDWQVGQTGKVVAPDLYIAVGISGAIQHLAGIKDSKVIVAINKDPDAPIFQIADYGLVMDLFQALPELERSL